MLYAFDALQPINSSISQFLIIFLIEMTLMLHVIS
jgi:hypothetical protein